MAWLCENGHEVRTGMFVCPSCGSEDVAERKTGQVMASEHDESPAVTRRRRAERQLTGFVSRGVVFVALGLVGVLVAPRLGEGGNAAGAVLVGLGSWALGAVGSAYLLCGIIGWGVKYGNEATAYDGERGPGH